MTKNYLKTAARALWKSKGHSSINIIGLTLAIACCILIALFVREELTFDTFHSKANRIFRAYAIEDFGENQRFFDTNTPFPLGPALKDNFQEVAYMVRINPISAQVKVGEVLFSESVTIAGQDFLQVFDFDVVTGKRSEALNSQSSALITESIAQKYFGSESAVGKTISIQLGDKFEEFTVKAVLHNPPSNSSIQFDLLISDLNYPRLYSERLLTSAWFNISPETYVLLRDGVDPKNLQSKFPPVFKSLLGDDYERSKYFVGLQPITDIHLNTEFPPALAPVSDPKYSYILVGIASLILIVACINFVTLSIGRSMARAKEVGIRKVVGAGRQQLIFQFIGEAVSLTIISVIAGLTLAYLCIPVFNELSGKELVLSINGFLVVLVISLIIIVGLFAGSYPAFVLSAFKPISILKGSVKAGSTKQTFRKVLVGVQLVLSIFLISTTILMHRQLKYLQEKNLGFDREQIAVLQLNIDKQARLGERVAAGFDKAKIFKQELSRIPGIVSVCASSHDFGNGAWTNVGYTDDKGTYRTFNINFVDASYISALRMQVIEGRAFSEDNPADLKQSVIVNEAFVREYGWKNPIGERIPGKKFMEHEVIGVVKDFNYASLYTKVEPLLLAMNPQIPLSGIENINIDNSPMPKLLIRLQAGQISTSLEDIKKVWEKMTGGQEFDFSFVDERLKAQYRNDLNLGRIVRYASAIAIIIGSLGLYALASLAMQNRVKEVSIRKVMGASEKSLLVLLSSEYLYLIGITLICSIPVTWYLVDRWLTSFEYRITIKPDVFVLSGLVSLVIALTTIAYQTLKTAWTHPAETLKHE